MVEASNPLEVHPTSILYVYKVFQHLDMLWMGICVRPYTGMPVQVGGRERILGKFGQGGAWEMLYCHGWGSKPAWSAFHIHFICIQSVSAPWYAVDGHMASTLTLLCLCRSGVEFRKIGLSPSPSDVVMSWLSLQTHLECIPHEYHMYTKTFITLICRGLAYGCTLTLVRLWRSGWFLRKLGYDWAQVML
jgi:hypothetical protein